MIETAVPKGITKYSTPDLYDYVGKRFELTMGVGFKYANLSFDWSFIYSPEGFMKGIVADGSNGSRDGQYRMSLIFAF